MSNRFGVSAEELDALEDQAFQRGCRAAATVDRISYFAWGGIVGALACRLLTLYA